MAATALKRSNIEASKRMFLDRLTTGAQKLTDPSNRDGGPGDEYVYANVGNSNNFGIGFDCSGLDGIAIAIALFGFPYFAGKGYFRIFSTESFPGPFVGFRQVSQQDCINGNYPIKVMIGHYGGGENSHMACIIDGWHMESNGDAGLCGGANWESNKDVTRVDSSYWNDWWVYDGPINEDTTYRTPVNLPLVLDYSAGPGHGPDGHVSGAALKAAGVTAVCRYLYGAGTSLPYKQLTKAEADDLRANGIDIVSNFEAGAQNALGGTQQGAADVQAALAAHKAAGGPDQARIYFSVDWDAAPGEQDAINAYLKACSDVLGVENTGIYGGFWPLSRALDAGVASLGWQTQAWSGGNVDSRISLYQRNDLGYQTVDGVQADINEAHTDDFGSWGVTPVSPGPTPDPTPPVPVDPFIGWYKGATDRDLLEYIVSQLGPGDPSWTSKGMTLRDFIWTAEQPKTVTKPAKKPAPKKGT